MWKSWSGQLILKQDKQIWIEINKKEKENEKKNIFFCENLPPPQKKI